MWVLGFWVLKTNAIVVFSSLFQLFLSLCHLLIERLIQQAWSWWGLIFGFVATFLHQTADIPCVCGVTNFVESALVFRLDFSVLEKFFFWVRKFGHDILNLSCLVSVH